MNESIFSLKGKTALVTGAGTGVGASLAIKIHDEELKITPQKQEVSEDRLCPTCKNNLVFVEGCSMCIECGYSGCTSG